jgi:hypothetical protein
VDLDLTYVNVIIAARYSESAFSVLDDHPIWSDTGENEFIVELTEGEYDSIVDDLFYDGHPNLPKWGQKEPGTGEAYVPGHREDLTDYGSSWVDAEEIPDPRYIVRVYTGTPTTGHIAYEQLSVNASPVTRNLKLFDPNDDPVDDDTSVKVTMGGHYLEFTWTDGVAPISVSREKAGRIIIGTDEHWRIAGPSGETSCIFEVYSGTIEVG